MIRFCLLLLISLSILSACGKRPNALTRDKDAPQEYSYPAPEPVPGIQNK
jgi:hypothetical protein